MSARIDDPARVTTLRTVSLGGWVLGSGAWAVLLSRFLFHGWPGTTHRFGDLFQRMHESTLILHGHDPYVIGAHISDNVPPAVSLLHLPLAEIGRPWAGFVSVWLSCAAIAAICGSALATVSSMQRTSALLAMTAVAPPLVGVVLYPGASALGAGQDQLWFMALVVVDLLIISAARTGYLVGAVASLSLWPAIFILGVVARARRGGLRRARPRRHHDGRQRAELPRLPAQRHGRQLAGAARDVVADARGARARRRLRGAAQVQGAVPVVTGDRAGDAAGRGGGRRRAACAERGERVVTCALRAALCGTRRAAAVTLRRREACSQ